MAGIQQKLTTGKGLFTPRWPHLGTGPVSYEDCISPEFFEDEQEAIFRRTWLYVGRENRLPKPGTYFVRELPRLGSIVVTKDQGGNIHALSNVCAHRGNKVVWKEHPSNESAGASREFACKYHGWRYGLDGRLTHMTCEDQFFDVDKSAMRMPKLHCDVFAGFIFVNLSEDPEPLREFLGPRLLELEDYPFRELSNVYGFECTINGNWKLGMDALLEWYHPAYVHGRFIHKDVAKAEKLVPPPDAYHYDLFENGKHMLTSVPGPPLLPPREGSVGPARRDQSWIYKLFRAGLFGPDDVPDIGPLPDALNRGGIDFWGNDQFWFWPNLSVQIWARNYVITYEYWPETLDTHQYRVNMYFPEPESVVQRLAQEVTVCSTIEFAMQDSNTVEATHQAISARTRDRFQLSDLEVMIRNFHKVVGDVVQEYRVSQDRRQPDPGRGPGKGLPARGPAPPAGPRAMDPPASVRAGALPASFAELEPWVGDWARPTRRERYEVRLSRSIDELEAFYDAIAPRAEEAIDYLSELDLDDLPADATRLLQMLYSMILVSYAVNIFRQPRIPDSGSAFFETVQEPAV